MLATDYRFLFKKDELSLVLIDTASGSSICTRIADSIVYKLSESLVDIVNARVIQQSNNAAVAAA